ncbi:hypothetical protein Mapa_004928 [Marchantia paleacea]|nr:hypothetical protein Mapa_004928 [Marchantia paleacea]
MSFTIHVRVIQNKPFAWYNIVEKSAWHYEGGGIWSEENGEQVLQMDCSGSSGMLRFKNPEGDFFLVALGIHNSKRWCDIVVDQKSNNTCTEIHPTYYNDGPRHEMLWKQLASLEKVNAQGESINVDYEQEDGSTLWATITVT